MCEILTDASAGAEDFFGCGSYGGGFRIETEIFINSRGQIQQCFGQGAGRRKRWGCIGGEGGLRGDARRLKYELVGIEAGFAYIGFDAVSTTAQEAKNPQRDLPIGIIASLLICTVLYIAVAAVLTGMVPWREVNIEAPIARAFLDRGLVGASHIITLGALAGLTSVMLVMLLGQTRVLYSMANDGLLPRKFFADIHPKWRTPWKNTILVGLLAAVVGSLVPIDDIGKMVNIGTLLAFVIVCIAVILLRRTDPDQARPFRTPWVPLVPILGVIFNGYMMYRLGWINWARLIIWLAIGLVVYFTYGQKHSKVQALKSGK